MFKRIFCISAILMLFQVSLVRLFSIIILNVSFFVLAMALFGFGLGGLYGYFYRKRYPKDNSAWKFWLPLFVGISITLSYLIVALLPIGRAGAEELPLLPAILILFSATSLPFLFGSMYIALTLSHYHQDAGKLYFGDLAGASAASVLAIALMSYVGGFTLPFLLGILSVAMAVEAGYTNRIRLGAAVGVFASIAMLWIAASSTNIFRISPDGTSDKLEIYWEKWNYFSWVTVGPTSWVGWRSSERYQGPHPEYLRIRYDGHAPAFIPKFDGNLQSVQALNWDITGFPYRVIDPEKVLIIGAGGGRDILTARLNGVKHIDAVELNPITVNDIMQGDFAQYSGNVYSLPGVRVFNENGRTYTERTTEVYDLVYTSLVDTLLGNASGIYVLSENHLYTVEAFESYLKRLSDTGVACIIYSALQDGHLLTRIVNTASQALSNLGVEDPEKHILAIMTPDPPGEVDEGICLMFSMTPFSQDLVSRADQSANQLGYDLAWPSIEQDNKWTFLLSQMLDETSRKDFLKDYHYDVSPLYDDRPYLFYNYLPKDFFRIVLDPVWATEVASTGSSRLPLLINLFLFILLMVVLLMLCPLFIMKRREKRSFRPEVYLFLCLFFLLGISFMLIEISLIQRLFLFIGTPTMTFSIILGLMLASAGIGSWLSGKFPQGSQRTFLILAATAAIGVQTMVMFILPPLLSSFQPLPLLYRVLVLVPFVSAISVPMGMLLPSCIRFMNLRGLDMTSWALGLNGVGSVVGSVGASLLAINLGITAVYLIGICGYVLFLGLLFLSPPHTSVSAGDDPVGSG